MSKVNGLRTIDLIPRIINETDKESRGICNRRININTILFCYYAQESFTLSEILLKASNNSFPLSEMDRNPQQIPEHQQFPFKILPSPPLPLSTFPLPQRFLKDSQTSATTEYEVGKDENNLAAQSNEYKLIVAYFAILKISYASLNEE